MTSYRELLQAARAAIEEVDATAAQALLASDDAPVLVDVRERDEWEAGPHPGRRARPARPPRVADRGAAPDRLGADRRSTAPSGNRSAFAAKTLDELGYENVVSLAGGFTDWKRSGLPTDLPRTLGPSPRTRYSRHLLIPEVGEEGQLKLLDSRDPADRRRRARLARVALPRRGRRRHARDRRRGRRRRDEPPAPDRRTRPTRSASRRSTRRARTIEALNPDVEVAHLPRAPDLREHRADPRPTAGT